ncbi:MAG TPA: hypothetical protein VK166_16550 [Chitinophagaceae bacterium]|nr:hypothetical protein [Chitinophagaceae bacterium]
MGELEIDTGNGKLVFHARIITYGNAADELVTERIRSEIESMWNEPQASVKINNMMLDLEFRIEADIIRAIAPVDVVSNLDPRNNYFRIEERSVHNISFVDGLGCNSGYFQYDNLYEGSTTAAHEFGHTIGLEHPMDLDFRGYGVPGIMYPRGTLVDPEFQYDPNIEAGLPGGTMHPKFRKVRLEDIRSLNLYRIRFSDNKAVLGEFTNVYHSSHD